MCASNGKGKRSVAVRNTPHRTGTHMSCGSQCYLPPGGGDIPALTRNRSWYSIKRPRTDARLSWPGYVTIWCTRPKAVTHPSTNRAERRVTSFMRPTTLTTMFYATL